MSFFSSFLLGLIQGIAEFLPISSSGHLAIAQNLLGMQDAGVVPEFFDVLLHLGTLGGRIRGLLGGDQGYGAGADLRRAGHCPSLYPHPRCPRPGG